MLSLTLFFSFISFWHVNKTCGFHLNFSGRPTLSLCRSEMLLSIFILRMAKNLCGCSECGFDLWAQNVHIFTEFSLSFSHSLARSLSPINGTMLHKLIKKPVVFPICDCCWYSHSEHHSSFPPHIKNINFANLPHSLDPQTHLHMVCVCVHVLCTLALYLAFYYHDTENFLSPFTQFAIIYAAVEFQE